MSSRQSRSQSQKASCNDVASLCYRCNKVKAPAGIMCKRCNGPIKAICEDKEDVINKMIVDAIWNVRARARKPLVNRVADQTNETVKGLREDNAELRKVIKCLREQVRNLSSAVNAQKCSTFKPKSKKINGTRDKIKNIKAKFRNLTMLHNFGESPYITRNRFQNTSDYSKADIVLDSADAMGDLPNLIQMVHANAASFQSGDAYENCSELFCDGVEFNLGSVNYEVARNSGNSLLKFINQKVDHLRFINANFRISQKVVFVWLSMHPDCSNIDERFIYQLRDSVRAVQNHAISYYRLVGDDAKAIQASKIDATIDLKGSFLPRDYYGVRYDMQQRIQAWIETYFGQSRRNFLSLMNLKDLRVLSGDNCSMTCWQFAVWNQMNKKLLNIKVYDKILDLMGRDGTFRIGSRCNRVIGSKREYNRLIKSINACQWTGMTRLEVSICQAAMEDFSPFQPSVSTVWHRRLLFFMTPIVTDILNAKAMRSHTFYRLSIPHLIGTIGSRPICLLLIGRQNTWLVNANTAYTRHCIGTRLPHGLTSKAQNLDIWAKIGRFVLKYAPTGSTIRIYNLYPADGQPRQVAEVTKHRDAPFQPPGCSVDSVTTMDLPLWIQPCINKRELNLQYLIRWEIAMDRFMKSCSGNEDHDEEEMEKEEEEPQPASAAVTDAMMIDTAGPVDLTNIV